MPIVGFIFGFTIGFLVCYLWTDKVREETHKEFIKAMKESADKEKSEERKTGKWIFGKTMGHSWMKCSECCKSQDGQTLCFTYCPNCGAKMEGEEK